MKILSKEVTDVETYKNHVITYVNVKTEVNELDISVTDGKNTRRTLITGSHRTSQRNRKGYQYQLKNTKYTVGYFSTLDEIKTIIDNMR
jgi:hypothetical protein